MGQQNGSVLCVKALVSLLLFAPTQIAVHAQIPGTITSVAGTEGCGNLTADPTGDLYILDSYGVQKMAAGTSRITTVASGDLTISGGGMAIDTTGNLYIAQGSYGPLANTVQRIAAETRAITTVAGTKEKYDGLSRRIPGPATQAFLLSPQVLGLDSGGNLYIGEGGVQDITNDVLKITASTGVITKLSLSVYPAKRGDPVDPIARSVTRVLPRALAFDSKGDLYIGDYANNVVWKVAPDGGMLKRVAGSGGEGYSGDGVPATQTKLNGPTGLAFDGEGNLYIADEGNNRVRMLAISSGMITTVAGNGTSIICDVSGHPDPNRDILDWESLSIP